MATIADVALHAGVSIATVSRVLSPSSSPHPVSPRTAQRVREAAAALDFVPSALARGLASRHSGLLGLVVPDLADPHYPRIAGGAEDLARQEGLSLLICNTLGNEQRLSDYLRLLRARRLDAVLFSGGGSLTATEIAAIHASGLPSVLIGRPAHETGLPYVAVDNACAAAEAVQHLVTTGRRRIVHLAGPSTQTTMADRQAGYRRALAEAALEPRVVLTDGSAESGLVAAASLFSQQADDRPDALFAATDRLAIAALSAAADAGLSVPGDLALVGFDDLSVSRLLRPPLSSVAQPGRLLGETALRMALRIAAGVPVQSVLLPAHLVIRASSAPPVAPQ